MMGSQHPQVTMLDTPHDTKLLIAFINGQVNDTADASVRSSDLVQVCRQLSHNSLCKALCILDAVQCTFVVQMQDDMYRKFDSIAAVQHYSAPHTRTHAGMCNCLCILAYSSQQCVIAGTQGIADLAVFKIKKGAHKQALCDNLIDAKVC